MRVTLNARTHTNTYVYVIADLFVSAVDWTAELPGYFLTTGSGFDKQSKIEQLNWTNQKAGFL